MDRAASLRKRAADVTRRLFASLPHYVRVALVFEKLADMQLRALGRPLGAVFVLKGVTDLPDLGVNAERIEAAKASEDLKTVTRFLPPDFLERFAGEVRGALVGKFHNMDLVDEAVSGWLTRFVGLGGWKHMAEGLSLRAAKNYVLTGIQNEALNNIKKQRRKREDRSLQDTDDEGKSTFNPADPKTKGEHDKAPWQEPRVRRILEQKAHPDAPLFLDLLQQGYDMKSIITDKMLPHYDSSYQNWHQNVKPKILKIMEKLNLQDEGNEFLDNRQL